MRIPADNLDSRLAKGPLPPAVLVTGDEPLQSGEACDAVRAAARAAGYTEREVHFVERGSLAGWAEISMSAQALSLFAARRVLELRLPTGKPGPGAAALARLAAEAGGDLLLLVITGRLDRETGAAAWVREIESRGVVVTADPVAPENYAAWLQRRAKRLGLALDAQAAALLALLTEGNLLAADQEIRKLLLAGHTSADEATVVAGVSASSRYDVDRLSQLALAGDAREALRVLAGLRSEGTEPALVLWAILREMRYLWTQINPGPRLPTAWTRSAREAGMAADRLRGVRGVFARLAERASRADRIIKGRLRGNAWDELALLATELAGTRALPLPKAQGHS